MKFLFFCHAKKVIFIYQITGKLHLIKYSRKIYLPVTVVGKVALDKYVTADF